MTPKLMNRAGIRRSSGMTLLELLIALAIFAIISVMAYSGIRAVLDTNQVTSDAAAELTDLQLAFSTLGTDLSQAVSRPIRDNYGDSLPAFDGTRPFYLEWTRSGWRNPAQRQRSTLQRVSYMLEDGKLVRSVWYVLDRAQDTQPERSVLLDGVTGLQFSLLDTDRQWRDTWPVNPNGELASLPLAVEVTLGTERWGKLRRIVLVAAGA